MRIAAAAITSLALTVPFAQADDAVWAVRPEPGLVCMAASSPTSILLEPKANGVALAIAGPIVFVVQPRRVSNGYVEIERPNKQIGWVAQSTLSICPDRCVPTLMSNGLILIGEAHG
jgi:hypothetical protein